ncbi:uncharacterized protein LOC111921162 [Lactuca sativa]|uniref:uncharacterized protein LOC111921162 n=1 Tax=Lactuca sativa TaxID=4236 RepID=UPI000CD982E3|nr:uncharacterized protein LOC111921162 [Lactuca sativa]XP_042752549.1 uncharacterized protein LOC111921162 [Lactuca sativa]XP_052621223.1 uncharacterized protein LOC111921162 [Lactuca sativa]
MTRGNGVGVKGNKRRKIQQREQDSEESDEEYNVAEDEDSDESDECYSLDGDESEEILADFGKSRRVARSRNTRRTSAGRKGNEIAKPRKRRRVSYTGDDDDDDDEDDDEEFMSLGKKAKRIKKPREKKRVSYTEVDDDEEFMSLGREAKRREKKRVSYTEDDDDEDFGEFMFSSRNQRNKPREKKRVSYTEEEEEDDDDAGFMSSGRESSRIKKPVEKKRFSYTKDDDDEEEEEDDDDYAEFVSLGRKRNQRQKPKEKKRVSYTEEDEDDDDAEFMSSGKEGKHVKKPREKKKVSYTEEDDDVEDYLEFMSSGRKRSQRKKCHEEKRVEHEDNDDAEFMSLGKECNQVNNPREKKRVSCAEEDVGDDEDYAEFESEGRNHIKNRVSDTEEDEDDAEFMSSGREANHIKKPREKNRVSYREEEEEEEDYAEFVSTGRNRTQRKKLQKRISDTEADDDDDDGDDDAEFMSLDSEANKITKPMELKRVSYTEGDDDDDDDLGNDDDDEEFISFGREGKQIKKPREKNMVAYKEEYDDDEVDDKEDNQIKNLKEKESVLYTKEDDDNDDEGEYAGFVSLGRKKPQEKERVSDTEDDDDDDREFMYPGEKVNQKKNLREKRKVSYTEDDSDFISTSNKSNPINAPQEKSRISSEEDNQEEEDENDAEFKLSESDFLDDEDETPKMKKPEKPPQKKSIRGRHKKTKKPTRPKQRNPRKVASTKDKKTKKPTPESDSDFVSPPSSDHEYTISEEEREQMREARVYCANLRAKLRSSSSQNQEETQRKKYPIRKGKEKLEENTKDEIGKQVCGICLSEEAKRTVRGVLNCCRHYFCFSCIMEWSKVESRCPLCKQRFSTITKAAKSDTGFDSRTVVIPVPECDQVYEPSEEELRGYLDPYESVICTECHHGGEDALMLLCDICDSSAHTFCVGLGREVPEGNWYCDGCRPTVFGSLNSSDPLPPSSSRSPIPGGFDLNELYVPETPLTQQQPQSQQTRVLVLPEPGDFTPATTLRDRRRIHRQIHHRFLNNNRMNDLVNRNGGRTSSSSASGIRLFGSQLDQPQSQRDNHVGVGADVSLEGEHGGPGLGLGFDSRLGFGQLHPCTNRSSIASDACREVVGPSRTSQGGFHAPY